MNDISEQIEKIKEEIRKTPHHKGTEHYIGKLRAKISRLKDRLIDSYSGSGGGGGRGYAVRKEGDASVALVGPPSVGKSTLLNKLTNAESKIASYEFTTLSVIPGMMIYKNAYIQIFDIPGLIEGAQRGKGRGKEVISVARNSDLLIIMTDVEKPYLLKMISNELYEAGVRVNRERPNIYVSRKLEGGIEVKSNIKQDFSRETVVEVAKEFGVRNAEIVLKEKITLDELIDSFSKNRVYVNALYILNKIDANPGFDRNGLPSDTVCVSAEKEENLEKLKEEIWKKLDFLTIYLIKEDEKPNYDSPIIMRRGEKLSDVLPKLGSSFEERYKKAKIWGDKANYPGQEVSLTTEVFENLQVRFI